MRAQSEHEVIAGAERVAGGYQAVDASHPLEVDDPLHLLGSEAVPVGGERLAHGEAVLLVGHGGGVLGEVVRAPAGEQLLPDRVHTRHV